MSNQNLIVCKNFKLVKKLGTGAFGEIYLAENRSNKDERIAAKLEQASTKFPQLYFEAKTYKYLNSSGSVTGIPKVHAMTTQGKYNIMLMDLLGKSLQDLFVDHDKKFSLKTVLMIGQQMIDRIEYLHERQIIHRDIKPDNFLMGVSKNCHILYVVDLGLCKKYTKDNKHIPYKEGKELTGTARYASINTHMGIEQSRRDDIEAIGYVIMYLLRGILPWQNMKAKDTKTKYKMILEKKMSTPAEVLCKGFPNELAKFINYAKGLKFEQKPDYDYLKSLIQTAKKSQGIATDYVYDWTTDIENKNIVQKKSESISKPLGMSVNKQLEQQKSITLIQDDNKLKQSVPPPTNNSLQNKKLILTTANSSSKPVIHPANTFGSKQELRTVANTTVAKQKTLAGFMGSQLEAMGTKFTGPKISIVKR